MVVYTSQNSEQILNANKVFHGEENWVIANDNFEIIAKGNYGYSNGKFYAK